MNTSASRLLLVGAAALLLQCFAASAQEPVRATPITPGNTPPAEEPADPNAPKLEELLEFANLLYKYGKYEDAVVKYTEFLKEHATSPNAPTGWYRLADCYRRLDKQAEAKQCYDTLIKKHPDSPFTGNAAYTMAVFTFNEDKYEEALPYFQTATLKLKEPAIRMEMQYFYGRALQLLGKKDEAMAEYEVLLKYERWSHFKENGQLELANMLAEKGENAKAVVHFKALAAESKDPKIKDNARYMVGILTLEDNPEEAEKFLRETLDSKTADANQKAQAQIALMTRAYEKEQYQEVTKLFALAPIAAKGEIRAKLEIMVAHSQRQLKNYPEAIRLYGAIERQFPGTKEATESGFRKLQCFHVVGDKDLPLYVDRYVAVQSQVDANTPYLDLALLLKAERLFENKNYAEAAEAYSQVRPDKIDESYGPDRLYKMAWALVDGGKLADGIQALGDFMGQFKDDPRIPSVLAKRASAHLKAESLDAALADYQKLADDFPKDANAEYALHQAARIFHQKAQLKEMVGAYQKLLERFPKTVIQGEANYWIGSGLFELEKYDECVLPLTKARELYEKDKERTSLRLILAYYHLRDIPQLLAETKAFRAVNKDLKIPIQVYAVLGRELYKQGDFRNAEDFLLLTAKPKTPLSTPVDIWDKLSKIYLDTGKWAEAIEHLDYFLAHQHHPETEARAKLDKAGCQLKLKKTGDAATVVEDVLTLVRQGRLNAEARILLGDIAMADDDAQRASELYVIVCQLVNDPVMTPRAMERMAKALDKLGKTAEADQYRADLKEGYPNYQAETG